MWQRSVRGVGVPTGADDVAAREVEPALEPVAVPADDVPAATPPVEPPVEPVVERVVEPVDAAVRAAELVAADTDPENEQADSARTASSAAGTAGAPGGGRSSFLHARDHRGRKSSRRHADLDTSMTTRPRSESAVRECLSAGPLRD